MNFTRTCPFSVRASDGSIRPIVAVNDTSVPFWTGVPAPGLDVEPDGGVVGVPVGGGAVGGAVVEPFSMTVTTISTSAFSGTIVDAGKSVITVPVGARSGTLSQAAASASVVNTARAATPRRNPDRVLCVTIMDAKDNTLMHLRGQDGQRGYAMAALLVAVAVMAVLMSAAMPVWRHQAQREKEAELVFRGEQWVKGLALWSRKNGPGTRPPSLDALVDARMVRKKWKDPITGEDFVPVFLGQQPGAPAGGRGAAGAPAGRGAVQRPPLAGSVQQSGGQIGVAGGIMGVRSSSTEPSIRVYQGQTRYDQWPFLYAGQQNPGVGQGGAGGRGVGPGGRGDGRGGRGVGPGGRGAGPGGGRGIRPGGRGRGAGIQPGRGGVRRPGGGE